MSSFCAAFNCSNRADREKDKSNYPFPSIVKNDNKQGFKISKVRRKKWLAQILRKDLTERKLEKTRVRIKIMFCASPSLFFLHRLFN